MICTVNGCPKAPITRGWCKVHYDRVLRLGTTELPTFEDKFYKKVERTGSCWLWRGGRQSTGYGASWNPRLGRSDTAHRVAFELANGPIPEGVEVRHRCDNPPCVRVDHLELGTHAQNMNDAVLRRRSAAGERQGSAKLTDAEVEAIRREYSRGGTTQSEIAYRHGISQSTVSVIVTGRRWRHLLATERVAS